MRKTKHLFLALLAVSGLSTAWASNLPGSKPDSTAAKTAYDVVWTGETNVVYNGQPQNGLTASYVDLNGDPQPLTNFTFTKFNADNSIAEVITSPDFPVNAGSWHVTVTPPAGIILSGNTNMLNIDKATVSVIGALAEVAKFDDGSIAGVVTNQGTLTGVIGNDPISHLTTAVFTPIPGSTNSTITLWYAQTGDTNAWKNYKFDSTSRFYTNSGVVIPNILPNASLANNGFDLSAYGYCTGNTYNINYHLLSGVPDQYSINFDDAAIPDVDWAFLSTAGQNGTINVTLPTATVPTGDYTLSVYFRDSRYPGLVSNPIPLTLHINLPETYTMPLFDNVIALVDTCHCFTEIQWFHNGVEIPGANGYYYREEGGLTGDYFVRAKMNDVLTYTCPQANLTDLISDETPAATVVAYPNPTTESVNITIEGSYDNIHTLRVISTLGVEMEYRTFEGNSTTVDMRSFQLGNYIVNVDGMVVRVIKK